MNKRLKVTAHFYSPTDRKQVAMSNIAFGEEEAQAVAQRLRAEIEADGLKVDYVSIKQEQPNLDRSAFHRL